MACLLSLGLLCAAAALMRFRFTKESLTTANFRRNWLALGMGYVSFFLSFSVTIKQPH